MKKIKCKFFIKKYFLLLPIFALCFMGFYLFKPTLYQFPVIPHFPKMPVSVNNTVTNEGVELGRFLFYDPILSQDSAISCSSCHQQKKAFSDAPNNLSKGINGILQKRNTLPLFNLAWYTKLFWDGRVNSIEEQVSHPLKNKNEMNLNWKDAALKLKRSRFYQLRFKKAFGNSIIDSISISKAISQFERTLISYNSKYDKVIRNEAKFTMEEIEGLELINDMTKGNCLHCHTTDANGLGTTGSYSNNGLDKVNDTDEFKDFGLGEITSNKADNGKFKIPSIRNLVFSAPYMHDGRFKNLEDVINFYSDGLLFSPTIDSKMNFIHQGGSKLTSSEKRKIVAFLKTLTDSIFVNEKKFSNPF